MVLDDVHLFIWSSGLDLINHELKVAMELKKSFNTDNSSSKKQNFNKLENFSINNPGYKVIYGVINEKNGKSENKIVGKNIIYLSGKNLLEFVFGEKYKHLIELLRSSIKTRLEI